MKNKTKRKLEKKYQSWRYIVAKQIFNDFYYNRGLEETCRRIRLHSGVLHKAIAYLRADALKWDFDGRDDRTGEETYGYKDIESIEGNLSYISDRAMCEFRLRWLVEVPERVDKLNG
jgi:hypothetical protein